MGMIATCPLLPAGPMARRLRVPVGWLKSEADAGRIPHVRAGRSYLFDAETVFDVLVERAKVSDSRGNSA